RCAFFFFSSRRRHTRWPRDWSSDVCSSDLLGVTPGEFRQRAEELAGRHAQVNAELAQATAQAVEWESRSTSQIQAVTLLREESGVLTARVEELAKRAESRVAQIAESEAKIEALRRSSSEAGESLLRLHGEQKQAEEALVHGGCGAATFCR